MNENEQMYHEVELSIESAREKIELSEALDRLFDNKDFKKIIAEGFLKDEAVRLVHLKAHPAMQGPENQAKVSQNIDAIGVLGQYFAGIDISAASAKDALIADEETLAEMAAEGVL